MEALFATSPLVRCRYANTKTRGAFIAAVFAMQVGLRDFLLPPNSHFVGLIGLTSPCLPPVGFLQGVGILTASAVNLLVAGTFNAGFPSPPFSVNQIASVPPEADYAWRTVLAFGAIPAALTFYYRMKMPETARFTALVQKNAKQAAQDMSKVGRPAAQLIPLCR